MKKAAQFGNLRRAAQGLVAILLVAGLPAQAQLRREGDSWVDETSGSMNGAKALRVVADVGSVFIENGGQGFRYTVRKRSFASSEQEARRQLEGFRVSSGNEAGAAVIRLNSPEGRVIRGRFAVDIHVQVPADVGLIKVETMAGSVTLPNTQARLELMSHGGNIHVAGCGNSLRAQTMGGNIEISSAGGDVFIKSGGGHIMVGNVRGRADISGLGGNVSINTLAGGNVQTAGGSINVNRSNGDLVARTAGGTVNLGEIYGKVLAETGGGNIRVGTAKGAVQVSTGGGNIELWKLHQGAQAQTGAGAITAEFVGGRGGFGESYLRTSAGDVVVYLSNAVPATVRASSEMASGRGISSEFPELRISTEGGDFGPKTMYADGVLNGGGPMLKVRTTIGQIVFRRAK